jgi:hypothetical protein
MKVGIGILAVLSLSASLSACANASGDPQPPKLVGPDTYLLWSGKPGRAEDHLGRLGEAIAQARDFCETMDKTPQILTTSSDTRERATFTCVPSAF